MRILTVGAGAVGGFFGARLAEAGQDVSFLVRPARAEALRARGLRVDGQGERLRLTPRLVTAGAPGGPYDLVLLSVKATALQSALADIGPAVGPGTAVVPLLNGMAQLDALVARLGAGAVLGGVAKVVTTLNEEGDILRMAPPAVILTGEIDGRPSARVDAIRTVLTGAGIDSPETGDIVAAMWHKWVFISTLVAFTCLMRGTVGEVNAVTGGPALAARLLAEAAAVSGAAGHPVPEAERAFTTATLTAPGSPLTPSLYRDLVAGVPTEADHVLTDLTVRARALGVATPLLDLAALHLRVHEHRLAAGRP
ncbi:2-dehydropantoate 2-reductase [Streptomyces sp. NRRL F-2664]|uniref:2-dehydropantoate 2-reductase n=1 Tax=Streptomyces sp. NRRL F-2664 TaxID=1463842 RepID=UPI0004C64788|nr:2-dehydropantoate 2-reductase [Streptomyces sp. NRRL F-2664]